MKRRLILGFLWIFLMNPFNYIRADVETPSAVEILKKVDDTFFSPKDQKLLMKLLLIDKDGNEKTRSIRIYQKGSEKRLAKFLSPADQKGIAFLSLPDGVMYLYLPAYKKVRRIASHVKNNKFAGTDFTYEDMEAVRYTEKWNPELVENDGESFILRLLPKEGTETKYSKLKIWVDPDNFFVTRIEYYDKKGSLRKIMTRTKIKQIKGYWVAEESEMYDLKAKHKTRMILEEVEFDTGLKDDLFTERYLMR